MPLKTPTASQTLAEFATGHTFEKIPAEVVERAKTDLIDTVAAATFGAGLPWSTIIIGYAERNGALAHAFETDSLCHPSVNVHPGASLTAPGLAVSQGRKRSGKQLLTAPGDRAQAERLFVQLAEAEKVEDVSTLDFVLQS